MSLTRQELLSARANAEQQLNQARQELANDPRESPPAPGESFVPDRTDILTRRINSQRERIADIDRRIAQLDQSAAETQPVQSNSSLSTNSVQTSASSAGVASDDTATTLIENGTSESDNIVVGPRSNRLGVTGVLEPVSQAAFDASLEQETSAIIENPLKEFASYSCVSTLAVLSKNELADPDNTYRLNGPKHVLLKSGGTDRDQKARTIYEQNLGITTEYFIEDIEIEALMTSQPNTKQTNATLFRFQVIEPYSMGQFFESIAVAVIETGDERTSYTEAPFLLMIEFVGYNNDGTQTAVPNTKRYFPIKIYNIEMRVNAGGSTYEVSAFAWNDQAFADEVQTIKNDVDLKGSTVAELLQNAGENRSSLTSIINERQLELKKAGEKQEADTYIIMFPDSTESELDPYKNTPDDTQGATTASTNQSDITATKENGVTIEDIKKWADDPKNINEIGNSRVDASTFTAGNPYFNREEDVLEEGIATRNGVTFNENDRVINIRQGTRIQDIIEELIIISEYGQQLANSDPDSKGRKKWFRIESETYDVTDPENEAQRGRSAKIYVYRVVPYLVHQANFIGSSQTSPGIEILKQDVPKQYDYIYSGQNDDIIDFELQFQTAFYQGLQIDLTQARQDAETNGQTSGGVNTLTLPRATQSEDRGDTSNETVAASQELANLSDSRAGAVSGATNTSLTEISRSLNQALINGIDLIVAEMDIWGDPYYMTDTGIGNYRAKREQNQTTKDGTLDYQFAEPYLILNFKTPLDLNSETGRMDFPTLDGEPVRKFSGIYKITQLTNTISGNKFTQKLQMLRLRNQEGEETPQTDVIDEDGKPLFDQILSNSLSNLNQSVAPNQSLIPNTNNNESENEENSATSVLGIDAENTPFNQSENLNNIFP